MLKDLHGCLAIRFLGSFFTQLLACSPNDYFVSIPVEERQLPSPCSCVPQVNMNIIKTTFQQPSKCNDIVRLHRKARTETHCPVLGTTQPNIGLASGWTLDLAWLVSEIKMIINTCFVITRSLICIMELLVTFKIKLCRNFLNYLTS